MSNAPAIGQEIGIRERRKYPRIRTSVRVEFLQEGDVSVTHAHTGNISCGGCYIETNLPLPAGTNLRMTLWLGEEALMTVAVVASHHAYFGNGVRFLDMSVQDLNRLNDFLCSALR